MSSQVEQIKERIGIADVVGSYLKLEKAGGNFKARCPFHNEKTPSFFLSPSRNTYYCFGCGAKGDIFSFVQAFEGLDFVGALRVLASRVGVELTKEDPKLRSERQRLFLCLESATIFFQKNLYEKAEYKPVVEYLVKRGLKKETIKEWRIGYAPDDWTALSTYLKGKRFTESDMEKVGLIKARETSTSAGGFYDRFRGRITFPLYDSSGRVIGFSGRIFQDDGKSAKYLNSPETVLFSKSKILYGFHKAKQAIREKNATILVEGQMDMLMSQQAGFGNTVAVSGTALTLEHLEMIRRLSERVIMVFDPDGAGVKAALRGAEMAMSLGMEVKVAQLPKGEDPALFILNHPDKWRAVIDGAIHVIEFLVNHLLSLELDSRGLAREISVKVLPFVARLPSSMERSHFVSLIYKKTGIKEEAIWEDLKRIEKTVAQSVASENAEVKNSRETSRRGAIEKRLIGLLFWQQSLPEVKRDSKISIETVSVRLHELASPLFTKEGARTFLRDMSTSHEGQKDEMILEAELLFDQSKRVVEDLEELLLHLADDVLKEAFTENLAKLSQAEREKDKARIEVLLAECRVLSDAIAKLPKNR